KKVCGKIHYFGPLDDPDAALARWLEQKDDLLAGRVPRAKQPEGLTLHQLCNRFMEFKEARVTTGELSQRSWMEYRRTCSQLMQTFGKERLITDLRTEDFEKYRLAISKKWGPWRLTTEIQRVKCLFKYAYDAELLEKPIKF